MKLSATFLFYLWAGAALFFGFTGMVAAPWELIVAFGADFSAMAEREQTSLLNQYRFLRGVEFGAGVLLLALRHEVLHDQRVGYLFVVVAGAGALGRLISMVIEGVPVWWTVGLFIIEAAAAIAVALYVRSNATAGISSL